MKEYLFIVFYSLVRQDEKWSKGDRALILIRLIFVHLFAGLSCVVFGIINLRSVIVIVSLGMIVPYYLSKLFVNATFGNLSLDKVYLDKMLTLRKPKKIQDILIGSFILILSFLILIAGGITMSYLWSVQL